MTHWRVDTRARLRIAPTFLALSLSQLLFLSGVLLIIGPSKTFRFFFQMRKWKGTACFLGGIALVLYGYAMIGIVIEGWGFLNLFGDFFPTALCAFFPWHRARQCTPMCSPAHRYRCSVLAAAEVSCAICPSSAPCSRIRQSAMSPIG